MIVAKADKKTATRRGNAAGTAQGRGLKFHPAHLMSKRHRPSASNTIGRVISFRDYDPRISGVRFRRLLLISNAGPVRMSERGAEPLFKPGKETDGTNALRILVARNPGKNVKPDWRFRFFSPTGKCLRLKKIPRAQVSTRLFGSASRIAARKGHYYYGVDLSCVTG
jgi:hypothetical protein